MTSLVSKTAICPRKAGGELMSIDPQEPLLERAVFLVLAELARRRREEAETATQLAAKG